VEDFSLHEIEAGKGVEEKQGLFDENEQGRPDLGICGTVLTI
jgi:hypothetical protein